MYQYPVGVTTKRVLPGERDIFTAEDAEGAENGLIFM
jgi:hypothetical protein